MQKIKVNLKENSYSIIVGKNILSNLGQEIKKLNLGKDAVVITNPIINSCYGTEVTRTLKKKGFNVKIITVPEGEKSKSAGMVFKVIGDLAKFDVFKNVFIVALGGGVVGDLAGYIAAIYKRGIPYVQVPTTFLAQIDSAIGGKVAIDLPFGKNLVGAFYQPKLVFTDAAVLKTISKRQVKNGLAEAVKYGMIHDRKLFNFIAEHKEELLSNDVNALIQVVFGCSRIKAGIVALDEREKKGIRTILNFGHTIGHAIESAGGYYNYQHGEAIALGMRVASQISFMQRMLSLPELNEINQLLDDLGLPKKIERVAVSAIVKTMYHDKKFIHGKNRFVLASGIGRVKVVEGISFPVIKTAIEKYM